MPEMPDQPGARGVHVSPVERDLAADAAGQPRSDAPPLPPPGTTVSGFWQSPATVAALAATLSLGLYVARPVITWLFGEAGEALFEVAAWAWGAALGIQKVSPPLLWK